MNPLRLFREWRNRRKVRRGIEAFDAMEVESGVRDELTERHSSLYQSLPLDELERRIKEETDARSERARGKDLHRVTLSEAGERVAREPTAEERLQENEDLRDRYLRDAVVKRALDLHRCGEISYTRALELAVVSLSVEREQLAEEAAQHYAEENPTYYWPEGGEPKRIPPFPDAWRCRTCRWWIKSSPHYRLGDCTLVERDNAHAKLAGHDASLETAPDFGCIQWEPKED